jgi:hypothetical protein
MAHDTMPCPYCGADIYDDSERCASCGSYLSDEDAPSGRSWSFRLMALICLAVAVCWALLWL